MKRSLAILLALLFTGASFAQVTPRVCPPHVPGTGTNAFRFHNFNRGFGFGGFGFQQPIIIAQPSLGFGGYGGGLGYGGFNAGFGYGAGAGCCGQAAAFVPQFNAGGCCGQQVIQQPVIQQPQIPQLALAAQPCSTGLGFGAGGYGGGLGFGAGVSPCANAGLGFGGFNAGIGTGCGVGTSALGFGNQFGLGFNRFGRFQNQLRLRGSGVGSGILGNGVLPIAANIFQAVLGGGFGNGFLGNNNFARNRNFVRRR